MVLGSGPAACKDHAMSLPAIELDGSLVDDHDAMPDRSDREGADAPGPEPAATPAATSPARIVGLQVAIAHALARRSAKKAKR